MLNTVLIRRGSSCGENFAAKLFVGGYAAGRGQLDREAHWAGRSAANSLVSRFGIKFQLTAIQSCARVRLQDSSAVSALLGTTPFGKTRR
jgi:hypothetical protein